jgi:circadian clock protein KaiC
MHNGKQNHRGKACGRQFVVEATTRVIAEGDRMLVERLLCEKISLHGICCAYAAYMDVIPAARHGGVVIYPRQRGEFAVVYSFEEGLPTLLARAAGLGLHLHEHIAAGHLRIEQLDPAELLLGEFIHRVRRSVEQEHARVVIFDSLNGLLQALPGEQFLSVQLHELLAFLNYQGVVTLLVLGQVGVLGESMHGPVNLSYLADTVLLLRYFETEGRIRTALSVVKKRGSAHKQTIRELQSGPGRIQIGEPLITFSGVLTGVPPYTGAEEPLLPKA